MSILLDFVRKLTYVLQCVYPVYYIMEEWSIEETKPTKVIERDTQDMGSCRTEAIFQMYF